MTIVSEPGRAPGLIVAVAGAGLLVFALANRPSGRHTAQSQGLWTYPWCGPEQVYFSSLFDHHNPRRGYADQDALFVTAYNGDRRRDCHMRPEWNTATATVVPGRDLDLNIREKNYCNSAGQPCWRYDGHSGHDLFMCMQSTTAGSLRPGTWGERRKGRLALRSA